MSGSAHRDLAFRYARCARHVLVRHTTIDVDIGTLTETNLYRKVFLSSIHCYRDSRYKFAQIKRPEVLYPIMDAIKNAAKAATGQDSQFTSGKTFVTTHDLEAYTDSDN